MNWPNAYYEDTNEGESTDRAMRTKRVTETSEAVDYGIAQRENMPHESARQAP